MTTPKDNNSNPAPNDPVISGRPGPLKPGQTISGQPSVEQAAQRDPVPDVGVSGPDRTGENQPGANRPDPDQPGATRTGQAPERDAFSFSAHTVGTPPVSAMSIGSVLARSFTALRANPVVFLGLGLLAAVPSCFLLLLLPPTQVMELLVRVVNLICGLAVQGGTAYALVRMLLGGNVTLGQAIARGMARIGALAGAALLMGVGTAFGLGLFILPGLFLLCLWAVTIPVCAVEKLGPLKSMIRSADLTQGYRMTIFALIVLSALIVIVVTGVAGGLVVALVRDPFIAGVLITLILAVPQAFCNILIAVIYCDLRSIKEGATAESLDNAFA